MANKHIDEYRSFLQKHRYSLSTISNYVNQIEQLMAYFPQKDISTLSKKAISEYIKYLDESCKLAPSSIRVTIHSLECFYSRYLKKPIDVQSIPRNKIYNSTLPDILTPEEVLRVIDTISNEKHKLIVMLMYSSGLSLAEVMNLEVKDIGFKGKFIRLKNKSINRSIVSDFVFDKLAKYIGKNRTNRYLFESHEHHVALSQRTIQKIFTDAITKSGINKRLSIKDLRHSFVIHLRDYGYPLISILSNLGYENPTTLLRYSKIGLIPPKRIISPLDLITAGHFDGKVDTSHLDGLLTVISDQDDRDYFQEIIRCVNANALRSSIIMLWIFAINTINKRCFQQLSNFNVALKKHVHNAKPIITIEDFDYIKESKILLAGEEITLFDKSERQMLEHCLDIRNKCSHPANYRPSPEKVISFADDIIRILFK